MLGCLKIARLHGTRLYRCLGLAFVAQFFLLRVLVSNYYLAWMTHAVLALQQRPWWAWAGEGQGGYHTPVSWVGSCCRGTDSDNLQPGASAP